MGYWDRKKVLVTGGGGFIGSHVVELLLASGRGTTVTVGDHAGPVKRRNLAAVWKDVRFVSADLDDPAAARRLCKGQDVVINMAASVGGVGWNSTHPGSHKILKYLHPETKRMRRIMECQFCKKQFRKRCNFFDHLRIHTNEKPFVCDILGCGKSFSQSANLQKHIDLHNGAKKYNCGNC